MNNFAVLDIKYAHLENTIAFQMVSDTPCHLFCRYTHVKPRKHPRWRLVRGLYTMDGAYFCFVAWETVEQQEAGDTLRHTFVISPWSRCQTKWFDFYGTVGGFESPSGTAIFTHHHPGVTEQTLTTTIAHDYDDCTASHVWISACPLRCPFYLEAGYITAVRWWMGAGLRFRNFPVPWKALILEAHLIIISQITNTRFCYYTHIAAEQEDSPPDFSQDTPASLMDRYGNSGIKIDWDNIPPWTIDVTYTSPDITPVIQAIVNRTLWEPENALVLFWNDWDKRQTHAPVHTRRSYSFNQEPTKAVKLYVKYKS